VTRHEAVAVLNPAVCVTDAGVIVWQSLPERRDHAVVGRGGREHGEFVRPVH
jgi:hypothetical protein